MSDLLYLEHILERIERIERAAASGRDAFMASDILQDAVIRNFEVIGEAVKQLSAGAREQHPDVPWRRIAGFRDVLIHNYLGVDIAQVWEVIERGLPDLKSAVGALRDNLARDKSRT
jgi:uncharacterized protein with HEPN domain